MTWVAIVVAIIGVWLALKVVGALFKLALLLVVFLAAYWFVAPYLGLPLLF